MSRFTLRQPRREATIATSFGESEGVLCEAGAKASITPCVSASKGHVDVSCVGRVASRVGSVASRVGGAGGRSTLLAELRARIAKIEQQPVRIPPPEPGCLPSTSSSSVDSPILPSSTWQPPSWQTSLWKIGVDAIDRRLPTGGLHPAGLHEIKPEQPGDAAAAIGFVLGLGMQRAMRRTGTIVWVQPVRDAREIGRLYAPGLSAFGLDPARLLLVEPDSLAEALWVVEECLRGEVQDGEGHGRDDVAENGSPAHGVAPHGVALNGVALVIASLSAGIGVRDGATRGAPSRSSSGLSGATTQRRLSLAAAAGGTPCLLVTAAATPGLGSAQTRWRIGPSPSRASRTNGAGTDGVGQCLGSGRLGASPDPMRPEPMRARVWLERCRGGRLAVDNACEPFDLEWCDEAYRFRAVTPVAGRTADGEPRPALGPASGGPKFGTNPGERPMPSELGRSMRSRSA